MRRTGQRVIDGVSGPTVKHCVLWGNITGNSRAQRYNGNNITLTISYGIVQSGYAGDSNLDAGYTSLRPSPPQRTNHHRRLPAAS